MERPMPFSTDLQSDLMARLRRIEGQVRGVQRMIDEGRDCPEILQQMTAVRSAVHQASLVLARAYVSECLKGSCEADTEALLDRVINTLMKFE
jgi:DNA-binding FrmR family transcriptional regulator